jgi:hypothetical protein
MSPDCAGAYDRAPHHDNRQHRFVKQHVEGLPCLLQQLLT